MSGNTSSAKSTAFSNRANGILAALLVVFLGVFVGITVWVNILADRDEQYIEHAGELRVLSQELAKTQWKLRAVKKTPSVNYVKRVISLRLAGFI